MKLVLAWYLRSGAMKFTTVRSVSTFIHIKSIIKILLIVFVGMSQSACDLFYDEEKELDKALQYKIENNHSAAVIQLKKIIQKNKDNKRARLLLADSYLLTGQAESAEKEIFRAKKLGGSDDETTVILAKAMLMQGHYERVLSDTPLSKVTDPKQLKDLKFVHGYAYLSLGSIERARQIFNSLDDGSESSSDTLLALADIEMSTGKHEDALALIEKAIQIDNKMAVAWIQKGKIHAINKNISAAESAFNKVIELSATGKVSKNNFDAYVSLIQLSLTRKDIATARKYSDGLTSLVGKHPAALYYAGLIEFQEKNFDKARLALEQVVTMAKTYMPAQLLLGTIYFAQEDYEQAYNYLNRFVNQVPTHIQARKLLGNVQLKLGRADEAFKVLKEGEKEGVDDAGLLAMIGQAAIMTKNATQAEDYLQRANKAQPGNQMIKEELAKLYLRKGSVDQAIEELETSSSSLSRNSKQMLVYAHLRKNNISKARKAAQSLVASDANNPVNYVVAGTVELFAGQRSAARGHFNKALNLKVDSIPALLSLARMDYEDNELDKASQKYNRVLSFKSNNVKAMLGLAQLTSRNGDTDKAIEWIRKAYDENPRNPEPALILGRHYLRNGNNEEALILAKDAVQRHQNNQIVHTMLIQAYIRNNQKNEALTEANKATRKWPSIPSTYYTLARVKQSMNRLHDAETSLNKAISLSPDYLVAKVSLVKLKMQQEDYSSAIKLANRIQKDHPDVPAGLVLVGDVYISQKNYTQAIQTYKKAMKIKNSSGLVRKLYTAYARAKNHAQGIKTLEDWFKKNPDDLSVEFELANAYNTGGKAKLAQARYESILVKNPQHVLTLNNYAYFLMERDPTKATEYAKQAYQLQSKNAGVADTYGWILLKQGQIDTALPILEGAAKNTNHPSIHYHLAVALAQKGSKLKAKTVLNTIINSGRPFDERDEAIKLLKSL